MQVCSPTDAQSSTAYHRNMLSGAVLPCKPSRQQNTIHSQLCNIASNTGMHLVDSDAKTAGQHKQLLSGTGPLCSALMQYTHTRATLLSTTASQHSRPSSQKCFKCSGAMPIIKTATLCQYRHAQATLLFAQAYRSYHCLTTHLPSTANLPGAVPLCQSAITQPLCASTSRKHATVLFMRSCSP